MVWIDCGEAVPCDERYDRVAKCSDRNVRRGENAAIGRRHEIFEGAFDFGYPVNWRHNRLDGKWGGEALTRTRVEGSVGIVGIVDEGNAGGAGRDALQDIHHLTDDRERAARGS